ncbi:MAG: amino-acid N-acetyltransferase [Congregibacter sp.]
MIDRDKAPIAWFRNTAPYINLHRGATFVVTLPGDVAASGALPGVLQDIALLSSLGIRLILVHGSRPQIEERFAQAEMHSTLVEGRRITDAQSMPLVQQVVGAQRIEIEAQLSTSLPNSPMAGAKLRVGSGNFVIARPLGVVEGVDYQLTGCVRRIDKKGVRTLLDSGALVLLSTMGYSPTGETFNLTLSDVAVSAARELRADKLILLSNEEGIHGADGQVIRQCVASDSADISTSTAQERHLLKAATTACQAGVPRAHIVSYQNRDALLTELFTTDGSGTMVSGEQFELSRWATIGDVGGVIDLIQPLESSGVLLKRSRELLEAEIGRFRVLERDGRVIACAALYPFPAQASAELACIVTHPDYRGEQRAQRLLQELESEALAQGLDEVFVLSTQTAHWFIEQGFAEGNLEQLPPGRQALYNLQRNSKVFQKRLSANC